MRVRPTLVPLSAGGCGEWRLCNGGVVSMGGCARHVIVGFGGLDCMRRLHLEGALYCTKPSRAEPDPHLCVAAPLHVHSVTLAQDVL